MKRILMFALIVTWTAPLVAQEPANPFARWEQAIQAIEQRLEADPPAKAGVIFAGSSSIRLWDLNKSFPDLDAVNTGFGGSQIRDATHFAERVILKHEPSTIVLYSGDNDINAKRTPEQVLADFQAFAAKVHETLPECRVIFLAIKPSLKRWEQIETQREANRLMREVCEGDERLTFIDLEPIMLGEDGKPIPELFADDGLHLSEAGYKRWTQAVQPALK